MKLSKKEAIKLHRKMWSDMQKKLGDCPSYYDRICFKYEWCKTFFPNEEIDCDCFLCEYALQKFQQYPEIDQCDYCPIDWGDCGCAIGDVRFGFSPISEILALREK